MNEDTKRERDIVPDDDLNDNGQGQPPTGDSAEPQQPSLDIQLEHTLKEVTTETERSEQTKSLDKVETAHVLSFRGPMGAVEPQHGDRSLIELSGQGRSISVGRFVRPELRRELADELRWALRRWSHGAVTGPV